MKAIFDRIKSRAVLEFKKFFFDDEWYRGYRHGLDEIGRYLADHELPIAGRMYLVELLQKSVANRQTDWQKGVWDACEFFNEVWKELTDV